MVSRSRRGLKSAPAGRAGLTAKAVRYPKRTSAGVHFTAAGLKATAIHYAAGSIAESNALYADSARRVLRALLTNPGMAFRVLLDVALDPPPAASTQTGLGFATTLISALQAQGSEAMTAKYTLAAESGLYRITAARDIPTHSILSGDKGGLISHPGNLSQDGECWIGENAVALDFSRVSGDALVTDYACLHGSAVLTDTAVAGGNCIIGGEAIVRGTAVVGGNATLRELSYSDSGTLLEGSYQGNLALPESARIASF